MAARTPGCHCTIVLNTETNSWEIHPRFYHHIARGRVTNTHLHEVIRVQDNPVIKANMETLYNRYVDMIWRYQIFLQGVSSSLHTKYQKLVK